VTVPSRLTTVAVASAIGLSALSASFVAIPAVAATVKGDSPSDAVSHRVSAIRDSLQGLVDDKTLTDAQADKVADTLGKQGGPLDHRGGPGRGFGGPGGGGRALGFFGDEALKPAADVLGMSTDDVRKALRDGTTLAELAKQKGKSEDAVVQALVKSATARIDQAVKDKKLDQSRADKAKSRLDDAVKTFVEKGFTGGFGKFGKGGPGFPGHGPGKGDRQGDGGATPSAPPSPTTPSPTTPSPTAPTPTT
jgi:ribosomal protein S20